jgi:hypothetical protein
LSLLRTSLADSIEKLMRMARAVDPEAAAAEAAEEPGGAGGQALM